MNPVIQEDATGCGIACAAVFARVSYQEAKARAARLGVKPEDSALWSSTEPMQRLLESFGFQVSRAPLPFSSWDEMPSPALLALKWHMEGDGPAWHWAVFNREGDDSYVLDSNLSLKSNLRRDFRRMKPKWFLEVINTRNTKLR